MTRPVDWASRLLLLPYNSCFLSVLLEMSLNQLLEMLPDELIGTPTLESGLPNGVSTTAAASLSGFPGPSSTQAVSRLSEREQPVLGPEEKEVARMDVLVSNSAGGSGKDEAALLAGRVISTSPGKENIISGGSPITLNPNRTVDGISERPPIASSCSPALHDDGLGRSPVNPASTSTVSLSPGVSGEPVQNGKDIVVAQNSSDGIGLEHQPQFQREGGSDSGMSDSGTGLPANDVQLPVNVAAGKLMMVSAVSDIGKHAEQTVKVESNPAAAGDELRSCVNGPVDLLCENGHPVDTSLHNVTPSVVFQGSQLVLW